MWTLGLALWMFDRDRQPIIDWLKAKFAKAPELAEANIAALNAGHAYGETAEMGGRSRSTISPPAPAEPGLYRTVTGAEAISLGLVAGASSPGCRCSSAAIRSPRPARSSTISSRLKEFGVTTFQAEDEIAAICRRDRRLLCRPARRHLLVGPGHRAQDRGDGPCDHDRAAAGRSSIRSAAAPRPACRPRPSSPTSTRRSTAATATRRCR